MQQQQYSFVSRSSNAALPAEAVLQLSQQKQQCSFVADAATAAYSSASVVYRYLLSPMRYLGSTRRSVFRLTFATEYMFVILVLNKYNGQYEAVF
jgi:hypothetical protein